MLSRGNLKSRAFPSEQDSRQFLKDPHTLLPSHLSPQQAIGLPSVYSMRSFLSTLCTYLIRTSIIIRSSTNHKQFSYTACHCWRAHCFFKRSNFCPTIWKGIVTLYTAKSVLPIIASDNIHLYVKCRKKNLISKSKLFICSVKIRRSLSFTALTAVTTVYLAQFS